MRRNWTEAEREFVKLHDKDMSLREIGEALGRSRSSIVKLRRVLGLRDDRQKPWTEEECEIIRANPTLSVKDLGALFPGRSAFSAAGKRQLMGLRKIRHCVVCQNEFIATHAVTKSCDKCFPPGSPVNRNPSIRYRYYLENAGERGVEFSLSKREFFAFWRKPCTYCATEIETIGIDRVDPKLGYVPGNIVPCCSRCNEMKMAATTDDWFAHMLRILRHMRKIK